MTSADVYRYSNRAKVDKQIFDMRQRIIAERRGEIGVNAAMMEAIEVTRDWWSKAYNKIEDEVTKQWGWQA